MSGLYKLSCGSIPAFSHKSSNLGSAAQLWYTPYTTDATGGDQRGDAAVKGGTAQATGGADCWVCFVTSDS